MTAVACYESMLPWLLILGYRAAFAIVLHFFLVTRNINKYSVGNWILFYKIEPLNSSKWPFEQTINVKVGALKMAELMGLCKVNFSVLQFEIAMQGYKIIDFIPGYINILI